MASKKKKKTKKQAPKQNEVKPQNTKEVPAAPKKESKPEPVTKPNKNTEKQISAKPQQASPSQSTGLGWPLFVGIVMLALHYVFSHHVTFPVPETVLNLQKEISQKSVAENVDAVNKLDLVALLEQNVRERYQDRDDYISTLEKILKQNPKSLFEQVYPDLAVTLQNQEGIVKVYKTYENLYLAQKELGLEEQKVYLNKFAEHLKTLAAVPQNIADTVKTLDNPEKKAWKKLKTAVELKKHLQLLYGEKFEKSDFPGDLKQKLNVISKANPDQVFKKSYTTLAIDLQKNAETAKIYELYENLYKLQKNTDEKQQKSLLSKIDKNVDYVHYLSPERSVLNNIGAFLLGFLGLLFYMRSQQIYTKILLGMLAGAAFGHIFGPIISISIKPLGDIFIRMIKMVIVPLVFASLSLGVVSLGDVRKVGRIGGKTIAYYLLTTSFAIAIGLILANVIQPGKFFDKEQKEKFEQINQSQVASKISVRTPVSETLVQSVPTNPIEAMAKAEMLQVIFFALFFGLVLATVSIEKRQVIENGLDGINEAMVTMVVWVMEVAPIGVFALMAYTVAQSGASILTALGVYALVVFTGLVLQVILVYGFAVRAFAKIGLGEFLNKMRSVQLLAFSTSSSAATLPVTMQCAEEKFGVSKEVSSFVLPLGATINMDGTALYQGVAAVFIAQVYGVNLDLAAQLTILLTATLASIGTAAVPGAGIVILAMVLESVGLPTAGIALIMGVDRILDMCRTTVNVTGDMSASLFINASENKS